MSLLRTSIYEGNEEDAIGSFTVGSRMLDCGCGTGRIGRAIKVKAESIWGIELSSVSAAAAGSVYDKVIVGSLLEPGTWKQLDDATFDSILFVHVLEHLTDPNAVLQQAIIRLRPGGRIVIALPNVANWRVRWNLACGKWDYQDEGIMDRTHLRFYTLKTALELLVANGLHVRNTNIFVTTPSGPAVRRSFVQQIRRTAPLLFAHSFLFECSPMCSPRVERA